MARKLKKGWIDEYLRSIEHSSDAPLQFHAWSALTIVSAALRRNVWYVRGSRKLFPNLYTILVGRPGVGKGESIVPASTILDKSNTANMLSDRLTMPFIISAMHKGFTRVGQKTIGVDHTAVMFAEELSTFMRASEDELDTLCQLWNAPDKYGAGTVGRGNESIESPCFVLLGGTTPKWLCKSIPNDSHGGGFTRRVNFVYAKNNSKITSFPKPWLPSQDLIEDLKHIGELQGEITLTQAAMPIFDKLYHHCKQEVDLEDEATATYKVSKWTNVMKIAMVLAACESDSLQIPKQILERAMKLADQVEKDLGMVFSYVGESDITAATVKVMEFVGKVGYATAGQIIRHMSKDTTWDILNNQILPTLVNADLLRCTSVGNSTKYYDPDLLITMKSKGQQP